jgi:hypothetical protein
MRKLLLMGVAAVAMSTGGAAYASVFPNIGQDTAGPSLFITFTNSGVTTSLNPAYTTTPHPYDGSDDTYFGVINNSSTAITHFALSSPTLPIAGFDGDGINASIYLNIPNNPSDNSGYGGPNAFFTNISADLMSLTVNFITPIAANGGTDIFSLEEPVSISNVIVGSPEPSTWAMMLLGFAGMGFVAYRKRGTKKALSAA